MATRNTHWFTELLKDNKVKIPLLVILYSACAFLLFFFGKAVFGYHVRGLGFEFNEPKPKTDTVYRGVAASHSDSVSKTVEKPLLRPTPKTVKYVRKDTGQMNSPVLGKN